MVSTFKKKIEVALNNSVKIYGKKIFEKKSFKIIAYVFTSADQLIKLNCDRFIFIDLQIIKGPFKNKFIYINSIF